MTAPVSQHPQTLHGRIGELARREPDRVALIEEERSTTFAEAWSLAGDIAGALIARGVKTGDVVAVAEK